MFKKMVFVVIMIGLFSLLGIAKEQDLRKIVPRDGNYFDYDFCKKKGITLKELYKNKMTYLYSIVKFPLKSPGKLKTVKLKTAPDDTTASKHYLFMGMYWDHGNIRSVLRHLYGHDKAMGKASLARMKEKSDGFKSIQGETIGSVGHKKPQTWKVKGYIRYGGGKYWIEGTTLGRRIEKEKKRK